MVIATINFVMTTNRLENKRKGRKKIVESNLSQNEMKLPIGGKKEKSGIYFTPLAIKSESLRLFTSTFSIHDCQ